MTLPASPPLSMSQVAAELGASLPLSMLDARVLGLAQLSGAPISMSNLSGKTGTVTASVLVNSNGFGAWPATPLIFGGDLAQLDLLFGALSVTFISLPPVYRGNLKLINNTTGASCVLSFSLGAPGQWVNNSPPGNIVQLGQTNNYTLTSST